MYCLLLNVDLALRLVFCSLFQIFLMVCVKIRNHSILLNFHFHYSSLPTSIYLIASTYKAKGGAVSQKERFAYQDLYEASTQLLLYIHLIYFQVSDKIYHSIDFKTYHPPLIQA